MTDQHVQQYYLKTTLLIWLVFSFFLAPKVQAALYCEENYQFRRMTVSECKALMQIYNATDGPNWQKSGTGNTPWDADGPVCDGDSGTVKCSDGVYGEQHVVELNLQAVGMKGILPGSSFANLPYLHQINIGHNTLTGPIPTQIAELAALRTLDLSYNFLSGVIPEELLGPGEPLQSPSLSDRLYINNNNLSGNLPQTLGRDDVRSIMVQKNPNLGGSIPNTYTTLSQVVAFRYWGTQICEPQDQAMQNWLDGIISHSGTGIACKDLPPDIPGTITASDGTSTSMVIVQWGAAAGADSYELERAAGEGPTFTWSQLATPTGNSYQDTTAVPGTPYHYRVRGCAGSGDCSVYTSSDLGYRALNAPATLVIQYDDPIPIGNSYMDEFYLEWDLVVNADFYRVYNSYQYLTAYEGNEALFLEETTTTKTSTPKITGIIEITWAVIACNSFTCSKAAIVHPKSPTIVPAINLLLNDR